MLLYCRQKGSLIEIVGERGSGKTSILHMLCAVYTIENKRILYIDCSGNFRPERIRDYLEESHRFGNKEITAHLKNISFVRIYEPENIAGLLKKTKLLNTDCIVIDDLLILFLNSHRSKIRFEVRKVVREMALMALTKRINVVFTNLLIHRVESENSQPFCYELFYNDLIRYVHVKALLQKSINSVIHCNIVYPKNNFLNS